MKTLVIALGGNALLQRGDVLSADNQYKSIAKIAAAIDTLAEHYRIVIVHGNGPQVGLLALQNLAYEEVPSYPLDILGAESQGMIGYMLSQQLSQNVNGLPVSTILTRVLVDKNDPAFCSPSKYIGPVYSPERQQELERQYGWQMKLDGSYLRRVVPSPAPKSIQDREAIELLLEKRHIVICCGGGGVPMVESDRGYRGVEAVIDKDSVASLLACELDAEYLMILTDADAVYQDWGTPQARALRQVTPDELRPFAAPDGAMGPKAEAAISFVEKTGKKAFIGALKDALDIVREEKGTCIRLA
ncbi:Carbamate kinase 2 [Leminorella richardii]|uniref:Carbamate kinase n=1 Tax=Leminorella richardii TaxID=158841 RepID=A0A2X4USQ6_9GAMM|nr:carbamate kinase [Leminorella richardii]SQI42886.1 Carbamate kinase 2 [Leminorella richardii]